VGLTVVSPERLEEKFRSDFERFRERILVLLK
jgi:hypothetical protein